LSTALVGYGYVMYSNADMAALYIKSWGVKVKVGYQFCINVGNYFSVSCFCGFYITQERVFC